MLDDGALRDQAHPDGNRLVGHEPNAFEKCRMALGVLTGGRQGTGLRKEQLPGLFRRSILGHKSQCSFEPASGRRRCGSCGGLPCFAKHSDGGRIPVSCRQLDVACSCSHRGSPGSERLRAALVRHQTPPRGRRLIDRTPDEWMPEAEPARYVGLADQVSRE